MNRLKKLCLVMLIFDIMGLCFVYLISSANYFNSYATVYSQSNKLLYVFDRKAFCQKKILESVDKIAWPEGTPSEYWNFDTGDFKDDSLESIYKDLGYTTDAELTACSHFVDAVIYDALGIKCSVMPESAKDGWTEMPSAFEIVHKGEIGDFELEPGDIIRYKKNKKNGHRSQHSLIYYGNNLLAESGINIRYPIIRSIYVNSGLVKKWDTSEVDLDTLEVIRIK